MMGGLWEANQLFGLNFHTNAAVKNFCWASERAKLFHTSLFCPPTCLLKFTFAEVAPTTKSGNTNGVGWPSGPKANVFAFGGHYEHEQKARHSRMPRLKATVLKTVRGLHPS